VNTKIIPLVASVFALVAGSFAASPALAQDRNVTIVLGGALDNVEPCNMSVGYIGQVLKENVIETLTIRSTEDGSVQPRLATSWEQPEPNRWRVTLRDGVKFHNGAPLDAAAVAESLNRLLSTKLECYDRYRMFANIEITPEIVDPLTLDLVSDQPLPLMPVYLTVAGITAPGTDPEAFTNEPVGTGPFVFSEWDPAQKIVVKQFADYWGDKPQVEEATYIWRSESALRAAMVPAGEADIGTQISPQDATDPSLDRSYLTGETTRIRMFQNAEPFNDIRVRQALNYATDRQALIGTIFSPDVVPATQLMLPTIAGYNHDLVGYEYNPDKARELIEAARADGVNIDAPIDLIGRIGFFPNQEEALQAMMQMWADVGINVKLNMLDRVDWLKLVNKPFDRTRASTLIQEQHDNSYGDAAFTTTFHYHSASAKADEVYPELDAILDAAAVETGDKRAELFADAYQYIHDNIVPDVLMFHMVSYLRVSPELNYEPNSQTNGMIELSAITFN
jgi:peptide/nickel transport system substrate-binding protein